MAFVCTLSEGHEHTRTFDAPGSCAVLIPIGYDDDPEADKFYNLLVAFDPLIGTDDHEFSFGIIEYDSETDTEYVFSTGRDVAYFVGRDDRRLIMDAVLDATKRLLNANDIRRFIMCTRDANAPQKAYAKFTRIKHLFRECGYVVTRADPYHGLQIWWMDRTDPEAG